MDEQMNVSFYKFIYLISDFKPFNSYFIYEAIKL